MSQLEFSVPTEHDAGAGAHPAPASPAAVFMGAFFGWISPEWVEQNAAYYEELNG